MSEVYVDTGGWVALMVPTDSRHAAIRVEYAVKGRRWVTSGLVLSETYTWLRYHSMDAGAPGRFVDACLTTTGQGRLRVAWEGPEIAERAVRLGRKHRDVRLSWADLVGITICEREDIRWVLGVDAHLCLGGATLLPGG